jgi:hypothetical protein
MKIRCYLGIFITFGSDFQIKLAMYGSSLNLTCLRAALYYDGEVHQSVKNFNPRHGYLRQRMVCWRRCKDN